MTDPVSLIPMENPFIRAISLTNAERRPLPHHLIKDVTDPWRCPKELLGYLAYAMSVDIWDEKWPETKKRQVIADSFRLHRMKTTLAGIRAHLALVDTKILGVVRPPARGFYHPAMTGVDRQALLDRLPQIRIYPFANRQVAVSRTFWRGAFGFYCYGKAIARRSRGQDIYGRKAVLWDNGIATPVGLERISDLGSDPFDRIMIAGTAGRRKFWKHANYPVPAFASKADERVLTLRLKGDGLVTSIGASARPVDVRPQRISEQRIAPVGRAFFGMKRSGRFMKASDAALYIYDRIALYDQTRLGVRRKTKTYWGHGRYGIDPYRADLTVSVPMRRSRKAFGLFWVGHWRAADFTPLRQAINAVRVSKSFRDTIFLQTTTSRVITLRDRLKLGDFSLGERKQRV